MCEHRKNSRARKLRPLGLPRHWPGQPLGAGTPHRSHLGFGAGVGVQLHEVARQQKDVQKMNTFENQRLVSRILIQVSPKALGVLGAGQEAGGG